MINKKSSNNNFDIFELLCCCQLPPEQGEVGLGFTKSTTQEILYVHCCSLKPVLLWLWNYAEVGVFSVSPCHPGVPSHWVPLIAVTHNSKPSHHGSWMLVHVLLSHMLHMMLCLELWSNCTAALLMVALWSLLSNSSSMITACQINSLHMTSSTRTVAQMTPMFLKN